MKTLTRRRFAAFSALSVLAAATLAVPSQAAAEPVVGSPAPIFTGVDTKGQTVNLADYRGKTVILEWTNHDCPFVVKHYSSGNMQMTQKKATQDGIVWLSVISSAPGEQGNVSGPQADALTQSQEQWLRRIPDDPGGLLRRKFLQQFRGRNTQPDENDTPW